MDNSLDVSYVANVELDFDTLRRYFEARLRARIAERNAIIADINALQDLLGIQRSTQSRRNRKRAEYAVDLQSSP